MRLMIMMWQNRHQFQRLHAMVIQFPLEYTDRVWNIMRFLHGQIQRNFKENPRKYLLETEIMDFKFPPADQNDMLLIKDIRQWDNDPKFASIHVGPGQIWFRVYE